MAKKVTKQAPFPTREAILEFIADNPGRAGKREIARAFRLDADQRPMLRVLLKELENEGSLERGRARRFHHQGALPEVLVIEIMDPDADGELPARPLTWHGEEPPPAILMAPDRKGRPALGRGDRVLARLREVGDRVYEAHLIRAIGKAPERVMGVVIAVGSELRVRPTDRKYRSELLLGHGEVAAAEGDLVLVEVLPARRLGLRQAKVSRNLGAAGGKGGGAGAISLIEIHDKDIPFEFPTEVLLEARATGAPSPKGRTDLRAAPLITIDGADARDFDDAVFAEPDPDPANPGGWHLMVAIADVAHYVTPGSALDREAYKRGNSVYFPDQVVPMLPEELSNGWCSLKPGEDRGCLVAHLWIDGDGNLRRHAFERALMRSAARLTYDQVQAAVDGRPDDLTGPLLDPILKPLYGAYRALAAARKSRGVLEIDMPERKVVFDDDGKVAAIEPQARHDSHRLVEEFMILANVAAAEALEKKRMPCMYRVHDQPSPAKLEALREFLETINIRLPKGGVLKPAQFNKILTQVRGTPHAHMVNQVVLRSQAQAEYTPDNLGHFGLSLRHYAHFTSPIRRYADLMVHRALIRGFDFGPDGLPEPPPDFIDAGTHISTTERRAQAAERGAMDRYAALFLAERVGAVFKARIGGVSRFGLFLTLEPSGADGLVPIRTLPDDYYDHDESRHRLIGRRHGTVFSLGDEVEAMLMEADPITGSLLLNLTGGGTGGGSGRKGKPARMIRKPKPKEKGKAKIKGKRRH